MKKTILTLVAALFVSAQIFALNLDLSLDNPFGASASPAFGVSDTAWAASIGYNNTKKEITGDTTAANNTTQTESNIILRGNGIYALNSDVNLLYGVQYTLPTNKTETPGAADAELDGSNTLGLFVGLQREIAGLTWSANYTVYEAKTDKDKGNPKETKTTKMLGGVSIRATYSLPM